MLSAEGLLSFGKLEGCPNQIPHLHQLTAGPLAMLPTGSLHFSYSRSRHVLMQKVLKKGG